MANEVHVKVVKRGKEAIEEWREAHPGMILDLRRADLRGATLSGARLGGARLNGAKLNDAKLNGAKLTWARLNGARLNGADLSGTNLSDAQLDGASFKSADLTGARLSGAILSGANLSDAILSDANLSRANLSDVNFTNTILINAILNNTIFYRCDLGTAKGLGSCVHWSGSCLDLDTQATIPESVRHEFLIGCGLPDSYLEQLPSILRAGTPLELRSCFISYSTKDEEFATRLYEGLRGHHARVWYAPEDLKGGDHLKPQIDRAIQSHEKLLIVFTEDSMESPWVKREILKALAKEKETGELALFPISLVPYEKLKSWKCKDDNLDDLAEQVRKYFIPQFAVSDTDEEFDEQLEALVVALRMEKGKGLPRSDA